MRVEHQDYIIENDNYGYYHIKHKSTGSVMKELRGTYTSVLRAIQAIDQLASIRKRKVKQHGSSDSNSRDKYI